jgi:hypothetical protein
MKKRIVVKFLAPGEMAALVRQGQQGRRQESFNRVALRQPASDPLLDEVGEESRQALALLGRFDPGLSGEVVAHRDRDVFHINAEFCGRRHRYYEPQNLCQ